MGGKEERNKRWEGGKRRKGRKRGRIEGKNYKGWMNGGEKETRRNAGQEGRRKVYGKKGGSPVGKEGSNLVGKV